MRIVGGESPRSLVAAAEGSKDGGNEEGAAEGNTDEEVYWKEPQPL